MPEGDTVHLAAARMRAALAGRELTRTDFRVPRDGGPWRRVALRDLLPARRRSAAPAGSLRDPSALVTLTKRLFEANRTTGSQITTGDLRPGYERWVYGRAGAPCRRCRTPIQRKDAAPDIEGDRVTYWCSHCQH